MSTFKRLLKKKLLELNYPVEISELYHNHRIRGITKKHISTEGIEIERERISEYKPSLRIERYIEWVRVFTNGYIDNEKIKQIVIDAFNKYELPCGITRLEVRVIDNTIEPTKTILALEQGKNSSYDKLSEYDKMKIARA